MLKNKIPEGAEQTNNKDDQHSDSQDNEADNKINNMETISRIFI